MIIFRLVSYHLLLFALINGGFMCVEMTLWPHVVGVLSMAGRSSAGDTSASVLMPPGLVPQVSVRALVFFSFLHCYGMGCTELSSGRPKA